MLITGRDKNKLKAVALEIGAIPFHFDISELESIPEKAKELIALLDGKAHTLVSNTGLGMLVRFGKIPLEHFQKTYDTNVFGIVVGLRIENHQ